MGLIARPFLGYGRMVLSRVRLKVLVEAILRVLICLICWIARLAALGKYA